MAIFQVNLS